MAHINLLPWREERRKELQNQFVVSLVIVAAIGGAIWGAGHYYHTQLIEVQNSRLKLIEDNIAVVDKKIEEIKKLEEEKERLLARMRAIEELQSNRPLIVRLFDEIVNSLPEGVSINSLIQRGNKIEIQGVAQSNARVSSFMRNISNSKWINNPRLDIIKTTERGNVEISNFTLKFSQVIPKRESEE